MALTFRKQRKPRTMGRGQQVFCIEARMASMLMLLFGFFSAFGIGGFLICWRYTRRFEDKETGGTGRIFTD